MGCVVNFCDCLCVWKLCLCSCMNVIASLCMGCVVSVAGCVCDFVCLDVVVFLSLYRVMFTSVCGLWSECACEGFVCVCVYVDVGGGSHRELCLYLSPLFSVGSFCTSSCRNLALPSRNLQHGDWMELETSGTPGPQLAPLAHSWVGPALCWPLHRPHSHSICDLLRVVQTCIWGHQAEPKTTRVYTC